MGMHRVQVTLTGAEMAELREMAGLVPLGRYVRAVLLGQAQGLGARAGVALLDGGDDRVSGARAGVTWPDGADVDKDGAVDIE